jgi:cytoskeletal protein RodZ
MSKHETEAHKAKSNPKKKLALRNAILVLLGWVLVVAIIIIAATSSNQPNNQSDENDEQQQTSQPAVETKEETTTEPVEYQRTTVGDGNMDEGQTQIRVAGVSGVKTKTYSVTYTDGVETGRELIKEEITQQPVDEVTAIGTRHVYTGYCQVQGTYRNRYAQCYGDYSPNAKSAAQAKAYECNASSRAVQGCYNTYQ